MIKLSRASAAFNLEYPATPPRLPGHSHHETRVLQHRYTTFYITPSCSLLVELTTPCSCTCTCNSTVHRRDKGSRERPIAQIQYTQWNFTSIIQSQVYQVLLCLCRPCSLVTAAVEMQNAAKRPRQVCRDPEGLPLTRVLDRSPLYSIE